MKLIGAYCVAFIFTTAACLAVFTHASTEDHQVWTNTGVLLEQAVSLEIATMQGCPPCKRIKKETIPTLVAMGYRVTITNNDTRGTTQFPTLYYLDTRGNVILKHIGFQTAKEVLKNLRKP